MLMRWEDMKARANKERKNANRRYWKVVKRMEIDPMNEAAYSFTTTDAVIAEQYRLADKFADIKWKFWTGARNVPEIMRSRASEWLYKLVERD